MKDLNKPDTQYGDLPGIVAFNASNLIASTGDDFSCPEHVLLHAQKATRATLRGSDPQNLLSQARAMLIRVPLGDILVAGEFDLVSIVHNFYPRGALLNPKIGNNPKEYSWLDAYDKAFQDLNVSELTRTKRMAQFEGLVQKLHIDELLMHSSEFKVDSMVEGVMLHMSQEEIMLRSRINEYMGHELTRIARKSMSEQQTIHVETSSLALDIHERMAQVKYFYETCGGGSCLSQGILFAGSASSGRVDYDATTDTFGSQILGFYEEHIAA